MANGTTGPDYSILNEFKGTIVRPKTGVLYHCCLFLVAGAMLLLPLIYFAILGLLAWATYYLPIHNWVPFYIIPQIAGTVVLFFMFKPLLARQPKRAQPLALNPADNPLLYAFISKICDIVGAPAPMRIDIDCRLNASAGFRRGFRSMASHDLVLTIGLPLVANFSTREFAGVIAHEFGHFTQGAGMRLSYTIRSINFWFARVAYQRDAWDQGLENWARRMPDIRVTMIVWLIQIAVWFSRLILKLLMFIGHILAGLMLRQMEYNADAYQIQVAGSETTEMTQRKLATLEAAMNQTGKLIRDQWRKTKQLPDNLSELLCQTHESLPPGILQKIDDTLGFHRTGIFDTHPSAADRIRRARMAGAPGIFHDDRPASSLFASFEHPARFVTLLHYTDNLGIPITNQMLLHVESKLTEGAQGYVAAAPKKSAADEFYLGVLPLLAPLQIAPPAPTSDYEADTTELTQLSTGLQNITAQLAPMAEQFKEISSKLVKIRAALCLLDAGVPVKPEAFGLTDPTRESAQAAEEETTAERDALQHSLREISTALNRRMQLALSIRLSEKGETGENFVAPEPIHELVAKLNQASGDYLKNHQMKEALETFDHLLALAKSDGETPALSRALEAQKNVLSSLLEQQKPKTENAVPKSGLQLAKQTHLPLSEIESLRKASRQWFSDYQTTADQLAEIAHGAEKISV